MVAQYLSCLDTARAKEGCLSHAVQTTILGIKLYSLLLWANQDFEMDEFAVELAERSLMHTVDGNKSCPSSEFLLRPFAGT